MGSRLKEALKTLCCNNGWSYGVFWRVNRRNSMLLTLEDAYFEEQIGMVIDKMLQHVHMLGEGIIGQAAFTGKHRWMFSDTYCGEWSPVGSVDNRDVFQDNSEFHRQFSSGIKTIAVISVAPQGVVQFGSTQKIMESLDFVDHIKSLFHHLESVNGLLPSGNAPMVLNSEIYDPSRIVASVVSSGNSSSIYGNIKPLHGGSCKEMIGKAQSATVLAQSSPFTLGLQNGSTPLMSNSSFHLKNQFQTFGTEAQVILSTPTLQLPHISSQSASSSANNSVARSPSMSTWNSEGSTLSSLERQLLSGMGIQESSNMLCANTHTLASCRNTFQNFQGDSNFTSLCGTSGLLNTATNTALLEVNRPIGYDSGKLVDVQHSVPLFHATESELPKGFTSFHTFPGEYRPVNATMDLSKLNHPLNNLFQWNAQPVEQSNNRLAAPLNEDPSQALRVVSTSSGMVGGDVFSGIPVNHMANSVQDSIIDTINSSAVVCDRKENSLNLPIQLPADNGMFCSLGLDFVQSQGRECWDDIILPVGSGSRSSLSTSISECISELDVGSMTGPQKGLFTEFGLERLLDGVVGNSDTKPSSEDQLSTTTIARTGSTSVYSNQVQLAGLSSLGGSMDELLPECNPEKMTMHRNQKEALLGSWIDDSYSINAESAITQPKMPEEPTKATRKRARPGESTRPRPKDRQQIQDRVKELREIVPNGGKCSIDALLDRTIKHMLFLQSVTKYADKLKQADEPKMIGDESGVVLKDNSSGGGGGATWAFEVGGQTMVCPIIIEDLSPPGQMLVEMLCEERGFFLEIADIIRGFGLTILKGVMEVREDKIWARFIVEANRDVTRMDIFLSLVQLLQQTSGISSSNQPSKVIDNGVPLFTNYQHSPIQLPIGLADGLQ